MEMQYNNFDSPNKVHQIHLNIQNIEIRCKNIGKASTKFAVKSVGFSTRITTTKSNTIDTSAIFITICLE